jgi:hypothetical protein
MNEEYLSHSDNEQNMPLKIKKNFGNPSDIKKTSPNKRKEAAHTGDEHIQEMKNGVSKIMVAIRLRPMWKKETEKGEIPIVKIMDKNCVVLRDPMDAMSEEKVLGKDRTREK